MSRVQNSLMEILEGARSDFALVEILGIAWTLALVVLAGWFWSHCARPTLVAEHASPLAHRLVLGITILIMAAYLLAVVDQLTGFPEPTALAGPLMVIWVSWVLVVGLGYLQRYRLLIRLTGDGHPRSE